jgi:uncharacterized membrane protein
MAWDPQHAAGAGMARVNPPGPITAAPDQAQPLGPMPGPYGAPLQPYGVLGTAPSPPAVPLWPSAPSATAAPSAHALDASSLGLDANVAAGLSYCGWWLTGVLVYFGERDSRFVRFHAFQSIVYTGALTIVSVLGYVAASLLMDAYVATHVHAYDTLSKGVALLAFLMVLVAWWFPLVAAFCGHMLRIPYIAPYAERYAAFTPTADGSAPGGGL